MSKRWFMQVKNVNLLTTGAFLTGILAVGITGKALKASGDILPTLMLRVERGLLSAPWYPIGRFLSFKDGMTHRPTFDIDGCVVVTVKCQSTFRTDVKSIRAQQL